MRKLRYLHCLSACMLVCVGADWLTDGGNPQRTAWQQDEHILTKENVKGMQILWKTKLDSPPSEMHSLFAPLIVDNVRTADGPNRS